MAIQLGSISFDETVVIRQMKTDFRDDWFPDPIGYNDFISGGLLPNIILENFQKNHGTYTPAQALLLNVPKSNFTLRGCLKKRCVISTGYDSFGFARFDGVQNGLERNHPSAICPANGTIRKRYDR
ncbi:hypothetical protein G6L28_18010 [Agrobacterium larrymoorei]|uniref:hypothetical protein n=1 Tax=Agrobacterium larrymoorei TaxID=160699 RepID=UPI001573D6DF|nr:hypothetical protein [Agrobacterium larrymoorei]NTJ44495.1 hypothetical protein [Agrobacterium larrymoorei]